MEFEKRKAATLLCMSSIEIDKSPKGTLDAPILPLLKSINQHPSYFTTSSCSGRISILSQPITTTATTAIKKKAKGGSWIFITHEPADANSVIDLLFNSVNQSNQQEGDLVFRFEPFILAIECRDISSAQALVSTAISCGFRESGITSVHKRVIIAIRCSIRLEVPLGSIGKLMVSPNYVSFLVGLANEKMESNRKRTDCFVRVFQRNLLDDGVIMVGTAKEVSKDKDAGGAENDENIESTQMVVDYCDSEKESSAAESGIIATPQRSSISVVKTVIVGEPVEKLFLWGHSACTLYNGKHHEVLVFGGFGGLGRHARRNDILIYHPQSGMLREIDVEGKPSPRMGHTSSVVGEHIFVIGGRGDPTKILNDVWVFNARKKEWRLLECSGSVFHPRHRHAAAVVGSKIYVFGGLNNEAMSSSMYVLDTENSQWNEINTKGEWPCARHSHALVSNGSQIFMFGGYDGEQALRDLYCFDTIACLWKKEKTEGRPPLARFSHSMFIYKNHLGIIGGCPVRQHYQEMALLDLRLGMWRHLALTSVGKDLFVRSSVNVVGDDLVIIGGGASCYAFGTKFSEPMKISLSIFYSINPEEMPPTQQHEEVKQSPNNGILTTSVETLDSHKDVEHWVLRLQRKDAKFGKDILKKSGWLDLIRKVYCSENGLYVCLPVTESFYSLFHQIQGNRSNLLGVEEPLRHDVSGRTALDNLFLLGGSVVKDELSCIRKAPKSPQKILSEAVEVLIQRYGLSPQLIEEIPARWERLGDIVVLPVTSFKDPIWNSIKEELWPTVAKLLGTNRLARQGRVASTGTRDSGLDILVGEGGWVDHRENGILYSFDATKCMFSWGNLSEKLRMSRLDCVGEVIVDLFAGIGYFTLPFLVRGNAKMVYACEWNPHAVAALKRNVELNSVADRCVIFEGDNRENAPKGIADRVCLGLLPSSECSWLTAVRALRIEGGMMHVHGNAKDTEESIWSDHVAKTIHDIAKSEGLSWEVSVQHLERVKWYGPRIRHLVADVRCKQIQAPPK